MNFTKALSTVTTAFLLTVGANTAKADTYRYEVKAEIDFSGVDPAILSRAGLGSSETLYLMMEIDSPQYPNTSSTTHSHTPDQVKFEIGGKTASAPGSTFGAGGVLGLMAVGDQPLGAFYNDFLGFNIEPRALPGLPFGDLGKLYIQTRYTNNTFDSVKLPDSSNFMANLIRTSTGYNSAPHVELYVFRNGPGTGFDWVTAPIRDIDISVRVSP
ncbi:MULTISPECIES: hypothetical protein [unclassified Synechococcus]|uniref:hypothetical protein n=1 Tax=unclassified Synechococcus TaxID=2626047 RepID=UPI0012EAA6B6|nr:MULTISPECIES: hypothetical protein [unclassified Synechococcus]WFN57947.1 hypothetical protein N4320_08805 [Synechococcus sp. CCFWC 502]